MAARRRGLPTCPGPSSVRPGVCPPPGGQSRSRRVQRALAFPLAILLAARALVADTTRVEAARLRFAVPTTWTRVPAVADQEAARYRLPAAEGDLGESV